MTKPRRLPTVLVPVVLVTGGLVVLLAGVYLLAGLPSTMIVGGAVATTFGLLVDV